jgi:excinuclease ABC subunit C
LNHYITFKEVALSFNYKDFLKNTSEKAGVYQMFDEDKKIIYIGKAKNLKNRLKSYFQKNITNKKTLKLVSNIHTIEVIVTSNETEALILESNLVRKHMPKYNVLLKDDKTYPYIFVSKHKHPSISYHTGAQVKDGEYFGPYPNQIAVKSTINTIQNIFPIRDCADGVYSNRSRPCLLHQIGKCSAPCVKGHISDNEYSKQITFVKNFLNGKDHSIKNELIKEMTNASENLDFENAAKLRDQIKSLNIVQEKQSVSINSEDCDAIGFIYQYGIAVINITFIRNGKVLGNKYYYPKTPDNTESNEVFEYFLNQYYLNRPNNDIPKLIISNHKHAYFDTLKKAIYDKHSKLLELKVNPSSKYSQFLELSFQNAKNSLTKKINDEAILKERFNSLEKYLNIEINRMECFDISHFQGEATIASCVVFDKNGISKRDYRRFNIEGITGGDDYAAMAKALEKRYKKQTDDEKLPDVIFIDGGKGQINVSSKTMAEFSKYWKKKPLIIGISKGVSRKHGDETILSEELKIIDLPVDSPARYLIWHIRDESHNHAITGSRKKLLKNKLRSTLEDIDGIGEKRRRNLINHFGGLTEIKEASIESLLTVNGINLSIAEKIYHYFKD